MYKKNNVRYGFFSLLLILPLFFACENLTGPEPEDSAFTISPEAVWVEKGKAQQFEVTGGGGADWKVTGSYNPKTAISAGLLTVADNEDKTDLIVAASRGGLTVSAKVKVGTKPVMTISGSDSIEKGSSESYSAAFSDGSNPGVAWSVSADFGFTPGTGIDKNGRLTAALTEHNGFLTIRVKSLHDIPIEGEKTVTVKTPNLPQLAKPKSPELSTAGVASWNGDNGTVYSLQLYKDVSTQVGAAVEIKTPPYTHDFLQAMRGGGEGSYTVAFTAVGDGINNNSSDPVTSSAQAVTRQPKVAYAWWEGYTLPRWANVGSSGDYTVTVYKADAKVKGPVTVTRGTAVNPGNTSETITDYPFFSAGEEMTVGAEYSFAVVLKGDGKLALDSPETKNSFTPLSPFGTSKVWTIAYGGGKYVAGSDGGKIAYSTDNSGTKWKLSAQTVFAGTEAVRGIAYNGTSRFVAVGYNGKAAYSDDSGATWTAVTGTPFGTDSNTNSVLCIAYGGGRFVAGGSNGKLRYSTDGVSWNADTGWSGQTPGGIILDGQQVMGIAFGNNIFVAAGDKGMAAYSSDGKAWSWTYHLTGETDANRKGAANVSFGNGTFVVAIDGNTYVPYVTSPGNNSGWDWKLHNVNAIQAVGCGDNTFLAAGHNGTVSASSDKAATWTAKTVGTGNGQTGFTDREVITAIGYGGGKFILSGSNYADTSDSDKNRVRLVVVNE